VAAPRRNRIALFTCLERSVLSELLQAFGVAVVALTFLLIVAGAYGFVRDGLPMGSLAKFAPLLIPYALPWTVPTAFVAACLMVYSRMASTNELVAVRASGIHLWRVLTPAALLAAVLALVCALLNHEIVPRSRFYQYRMVKAASASEHAAAIRFSDPIMRIGRVTVYVGDVRGEDTFRDIVIVMPEKTLPDPEGGESQRQITYVRAPRGRYRHYDDRGEIVFHLEGNPGLNTPDRPDAGKAMLCKSVYGTTPRDFERAYFSSCTFPVKVGAGDVVLLPHKAKHLTTTCLILRVERRLEAIARGDRRPPDTAGLSEAGRALAEARWRKWNTEPAHWRTEMHKRGVLSLAPILLGAVAVPLGVLTRRGRKLTAFALALAIVLGGYYPLLGAGAALGESGALPAGLAVWGMVSGIAVAGVALIRNMLRR